MCLITWAVPHFKKERKRNSYWHGGGQRVTLVHHHTIAALPSTKCMNQSSILLSKYNALEMRSVEAEEHVFAKDLHNR